MEDNRYKYIHKLTQFVTALNSRRNISIALIPKNVKYSDLSSILYSKPLRELKKPKFKVGQILTKQQRCWSVVKIGHHYLILITLLKASGRF